MKVTLNTQTKEINIKFISLDNKPQDDNHPESPIEDTKQTEEPKDKENNPHQSIDNNPNEDNHKDTKPIESKDEPQPIVENNEPIQEDNKPKEESNPEEKPIDNPPQEESKKYEVNTAQDIDERNKVVNTYLEDLDKKEKKEEEKDHNPNQEEPDEFDKADAEYHKKKEEPKDEEALPEDEHLKDDVKTPRDEYNIESDHENENNKSRNHLQYSTSYNSKAQKNQFKPILFQNPEELYIKEIEQYKRNHLLRKLKIKTSEPYSTSMKSKENQKESEAENAKMEKEPSQKEMLKYIMAHNNRVNKNKKLSMKKTKLSLQKNKERHEQNMLRILNDKNNPYSNSWTNQILATRYQVNLQVNGFLNGVPQFKLHKIKDELPSLYSPGSTKNSKFRATQMIDKKKERQNSKIAFPLIYSYFGEKKEEVNDKENY